jgi:hypothetical protein
MCCLFWTVSVPYYENSPVRNLILFFFLTIIWLYSDLSEGWGVFFVIMPVGNSGSTENNEFTDCVADNPVIN